MIIIFYKKQRVGTVAESNHQADQENRMTNYLIYTANAYQCEHNLYEPKATENIREGCVVYKIHPIDKFTHISADGTISWRAYGKFHRLTGPAIIGCGNNYQETWVRFGKLHREDGPAFKYGNPNDYGSWYLNGLRHRADGPARGLQMRYGVKYEYYTHGNHIYSTYKANCTNAEQIVDDNESESDYILRISVD